MLYLASNFACLDARDFIFGPRGLMNFTKGGELLYPDYQKSTTKVYMYSVEAALVNYQNTDIFYYLGGTEEPSWIPRWNKLMLFRNAFRLTSGVPWRPTGDTTPIFSIDKERSSPNLSGLVLGAIEYAESCNETIFGTAGITSPKGKIYLNRVWSKILTKFETKFPVPVFH